jgi:hypothetical protein
VIFCFKTYSAQTSSSARHLVVRNFRCMLKDAGCF